MTQTPTDRPAQVRDAAPDNVPASAEIDVIQLLNDFKVASPPKDASLEPTFSNIYSSGPNHLPAFIRKDGNLAVLAEPTDAGSLFAFAGPGHDRPAARIGTRTAGLPVRSDAGTPADDKVAIPKDASDRIQTPATPERAISEYTQTLERAGFSADEARTIAGTTYKRLLEAAEKGKLTGTPAEQMLRIDKAHRDILDKKPGGTLSDGQRDYLTQADRQNIVKDSALMTMNPEKYVNQGQHMTCALHSMGKQELEAGDPARVAERTRDLVNTGSTTVKEMDRRGPNGEVIPGKERTVRVDSLSLLPDREARNTVNSQNYGDNGKQGPAGQIYAALTGQLAADLRSEREGRPTSADGIERAGYIYMAAHAGERGARRGQTSTDEGMFRRDSGGALKYMGDGPQVAIWDVAHLNRAIGGADGAVFASSTLFRAPNGEKPPPGYPPDLKITTFKNPDELRTRLREFQERTGQSGQLGVNAPFLPGGGRNGHGMHAMNIRLNEDGSFRLDNNWGTKKDLTRVSDADVDTATNRDRWTIQNPTPGSGSGRGGAPDDRTRFGPGAGRNPNETDSEYRSRLEEENARKKEKEAEELRKQALKEQERETQLAQLRAEQERALQEKTQAMLHARNRKGPVAVG